ncbi:Chromophore lyase CRL chloroplastic [Zea mays]|uniref:Chromophore lyase CRL chloroplastic n=1 Tax=Zea mays TaxID=4577 RepID=A0A1D6PTQ3_MAIZE|nr:Chromophore lyase CRL chloroplastic [Zea mays]
MGPFVSAFFGRVFLIIWLWGESEYREDYVWMKIGL